MPDPNGWVILPEVVSKEPLGPVVRHGDSKWGDVARWTLNTIIVGEELGITSAMSIHSATPKQRNQAYLRGEGELGQY